MISRFKSIGECNNFSEFNNKLARLLELDYNKVDDSNFYWLSIALHNLIASWITWKLTGLLYPIPKINLTILMTSSSLSLIRSFKKCALLKSTSINYKNSSGPDILGCKWIFYTRKDKKSCG